MEIFLKLKWTEGKKVAKYFPLLEKRNYKTN